VGPQNASGKPAVCSFTQPIIYITAEQIDIASSLSIKISIFLYIYFDPGTKNSLRAESCIQKSFFQGESFVLRLVGAYSERAREGVAKMPNITLVRSQLFESIGKQYTDAEFDELCFEFGVEVDDVESQVIEFTVDGKHVKEEHVVYVIAIPANRYDLLCIEGFARAIRVFIGKEAPPVSGTPWNPLPKHKQLCTLAHSNSLSHTHDRGRNTCVLIHLAGPRSSQSSPR